MTKVEQAYIVEHASKRIDRISLKEPSRRFTPDEIVESMQDAANAYAPGLAKQFKSMSDASFERLFQRVVQKVGIYWSPQ